MPNGSQKRPRDPNRLAKRIVDIATGEVDDAEPDPNPRYSRGGKVGGPARAKALTPERRSQIARIAAQARWKKKR